MGTSIPRRENELKGAPPSPVKKYKLSPEELEEIVGKPIPKSHTKPIGFDTKASNPKKEKDVNDVPKVNKEEYLALRAQGLSRGTAAKKLGTTIKSIEKYWLKRWDINGIAGEEEEIARYKEQRKATKKEDATPPADELKADLIATEPTAQEYAPQEPQQQEQYTIPYIPVQLTLEQANALKLVMQHKPADEIVLLHSQTIIITHEWWKEELEPLNDLTLDEMIRAVYQGYELAKKPEELLLQEFEQAEARVGADSAAVFRTGLQLAADIFGHKVQGVNA
ncbi:helix-turn-helix domain-containing protein [Paenibacillus campinasensis]|uniref:Uncharacterized protein n=1 Tax=Paenibacillus campinasensis TaxID=66347 RepID=A0A268ELF8_9BACL|nr:helix-turn-helix domain-containing protein [Paenibacillus campinasensis]PAD73952.1 hypothetical protein CHH67_19145 [Paenibacillus campinasensis]